MGNGLHPRQEPSAPGHLRGLSIAVVGLGYVGLPTAIAFSAKGCAVTGIDINPDRRLAIEQRDVDIDERDLERLGPALETARLVVTGDPSPLMLADVVVICVPTPIDEHKVPDLRALRNACASVVEHAHAGQLLILTSTSYVGTTRELLVEGLEARGLVPGIDLNVAFCPERIDPGNPVHARIGATRVIGGVTPACSRRAAEAMGEIAPDVHIVSSPEAAEMSKLLENTFRAVNIAFVNEIADVCSQLGLDTCEVLDAAKTKPYGFMPFLPGPGAGGHCIPCDPHYLLWQLRSEHVTAPVIESAMVELARRPGRVTERLAGLLFDVGLGVRSAHVVVIGVTYKPGVADVRESPALLIMEDLLRRGAHVSYVDARVPTVQLPDGTIVEASPIGVVNGATAVLVHTLDESADLSPLADVPIVLDATYKLTGVPHRFLL